MAKFNNFVKMQANIVQSYLQKICYAEANFRLLCSKKIVGTVDYMKYVPHSSQNSVKLTKV